MHAMAEAHAPTEELVVQVGEVRDLFVAPDADPLAQHEGEVMGEPALLRVVRRLMAARKMTDTRKLVVLLPGDKIEPGLAERVRAALQRYCTLKLEDNDAQLRLMRREAGRLLLRGMLILLICVGVSSVFRSETVTFLPPLDQQRARGGVQRDRLGDAVARRWRPISSTRSRSARRARCTGFCSRCRSTSVLQRPRPMRRRFDPYQLCE